MAQSAVHTVNNAHILKSELSPRTTTTSPEQPNKVYSKNGPNTSQQYLLS